MRRLSVALAMALAWMAAPCAADAFCGFYVSGAGSEMFNNATQVVMMRQGTRTVLSMQNNYQGPPENFAMVVPVPVVLQEQNVRTLPASIFAKVDKLAAPRLVEYWEQDPCSIGYGTIGGGSGTGSGFGRGVGGLGRGRAKKLGVKIEAEFKVGEYDIVILSAKDSTGLDTWLREESYKIPEGAGPYLKPYVENGSKFFVAKVDAKKVRFENGQAMLSPLRFHYDSTEFTLPIRLGMMNSSGTQDLIVHILAKGQRYEVANYPNVTIPTNLDVREEARDRFGEFYAALFDRTLEKNPRAVITEYSWDAGSCDPCPTPGLSPGELATLGDDVLRDVAPDYPDNLGTLPPSARRRIMRRGYVISRLHARYSKGGVSEDLVFKAASAIAGGREWRKSGGTLEEGSVQAPVNSFQARYAIRHPWTGAIQCENPQRGLWGGPPEGGTQGPVAATDLAFVPRGKLRLAQVVAQDVPEIELIAQDDASATGNVDPAVTTSPPKPLPVRRPRKEKKGCAAGGSDSGAFAMLLFAALVAMRRRSPGVHNNN